MGIDVTPSAFVRLPTVPRPQLLGRGVLSVGPFVPVPAMVGDLWWRTDPDGALFLYYDDGSSAQWVTASPGVGLLSGTPPAWIQFPDSPLTVGQTFTGTNGITYTWDGTVWVGSSALWTMGLAQLDGTTVPVLVSPNGLLLPAGDSLFFQPGVLQPGVGGPPWIANGASGNPWLVLGTNGLVGIGGPTMLGVDPVEALDVYGGIRLSAAKDTNPATLPGTLQYVGGQLEVYTPAGWQNVISSAAGGGPAPPTTFPGPIIIDGAGATAPVAGEIAWNGTNFIAYDGTTWRTLDVPWGPAGGDFAGSSYPNPVIAPGAVTDAKIASVSWSKITGAPLPITRPNLGVNANIGGSSSIPSPANFNSIAANVWTPYATLPAIATRGGVVLLLANPCLAFNTAGSYSSPITASVESRWVRDPGGANVSILPTTQQGNSPFTNQVPGLCWVDSSAPAGTHVYQYQVLETTNAGIFSAPNGDGGFAAIEIG